MANRRNSIKKIKADEAKRLRNRAAKSELKTATRKYLEACEQKKFDDAAEIGKNLFSKLDKAIKSGVLKENTVNRKKSRLAKRLNVAQAA